MQGMCIMGGAMMQIWAEQLHAIGGANSQNYIYYILFSKNLIYWIHLWDLVCIHRYIRRELSIIYLIMIEIGDNNYYLQYVLVYTYIYAYRYLYIHI